jgi:hypothetical protein
MATADPRLVAALAAFPAPLRARLDGVAAALGITPVALVQRLVRDELARLDRQRRSRTVRDQQRRPTGRGRRR